MAQWLVHLLHKQKVGVQFPVMARAFFPTSIFYLPFRPTSSGKVIELTIHQFGRILSSDFPLKYGPGLVGLSTPALELDGSSILTVSVEFN